MLTLLLAPRRQGRGRCGCGDIWQRGAAGQAAHRQGGLHGGRHAALLGPASTAVPPLAIHAKLHLNLHAQPVNLVLDDLRRVKVFAGHSSELLCLQLAQHLALLNQRLNGSFDPPCICIPLPLS